MRRKDSKRRVNLPWLTKEVKQSIKLKEKASKEAKDWDKFRIQQRKTKKMREGKKP